MRIRLINSHMFIECDLLCASYNTSFKGFYFEGRFKPEVIFMQVDDGLTHMLDEVFGSLIKDLLTLITELPTLTVSPCDTLFCLFTHSHTPHIQFLTAKKNIIIIFFFETRSFLSKLPDGRWRC